MPQPHPPAEQITFRSSFNLLYLIATVHARCVTPFMRDRIGARAQGIFSFIAGATMFYAACVAEDQFFVYFVVAWLVMVINQRADSARFRKRHQVHSQFSGRPALASLLGFKDEGAARLVVEPIICFGAGIVLSHWSTNVGSLVGLAGVSLMLTERLSRRIQENREQAVMDAQLEAQQTANGVHDRLGY